MSAPNPTLLDAGQVLQGAFDETTGRIRTDAEATILNADIEVELDSLESSVAIGDAITGDKAKVNPAGELAVITDANTSSMEVFQIDHDGLNTNANLQVGNSDVSNLNPVPVSLSPGFATSVNQEETNALLTTQNVDIANINTKLPNLGQNNSANSLSVVLSSDQAAIETLVELDAFTKPSVDNVLLVGSIDGLKNGLKYGIVYNKRQQVLDSHDRVAEFVYADFGTKDQRITRIDYTSATFPGVIIRRDFAYTLISNRYRRDSETWSEV